MIDYYDVLFADLEGTELYFEFLNSHIKGHNILEFACGTGDLLNRLSSEYQVTGIDISEDMIDILKIKYPHLADKVHVGDFLSHRSNVKYDSVICVGDSLNYILDEEDLKRFVETSTRLSDTIIVDFHHPYRINEFNEGYFEEGSTDSFDYNYIIELDGDYLIHTINFLDGNFEQVSQWVFKPNQLIELFEKQGYLVKIYTDFDFPGLLDEGEKVFCVFERKSI